ncbi:amylosucrase [Aureimonas endophytica]|uniref:Amylosucrase n=1 Tax=Aureimonas endophytica TaxID=2027858 RepID=A0A917A1J9_9HYPH|nr:amylosucrase [Aureimonas endophytica]GGE21025.1 amylosucrase [Aureimonas endophytica]
MHPSQEEAYSTALAALGRLDLSPDPDFDRRLAAHFPALFTELSAVYADHPRFLDELAATICLARRSYDARAAELKALDAAREADPAWFQSNRMLGGVAYVDRYAGTLQGLAAELPYFEELGLTYLHLMPLFRAPAENSDGGYAVSSYREVDPRLGTMAELEELAGRLRRRGISLTLDFVFNHTSNEHEWARRALAGEKDYENFYWIFPDRTLPDAYERTTREIFPDDHPGSFVQLPDGRWIWATFYHFQWDLNYSNPAVFRAMGGEMLFLANRGVEILRMDAVAFIWKRLGTTCESLPEAHRLLRAFNALCRIAAPAMIFKSEAIVHPDEVVTYVDPAECPISYNPLMMALGWEALATRDARLLAQAVERRETLPPGCAWVNYVRSHDDIGWTFADEDAAELGINGFDHRRFLNEFYVGRFPGSFAQGEPFQENPRTGDCRIAGTTASLAGLGRDEEAGIDRILLLHSLALALPGIPLLYLGDEVGQRNDPTWRQRPGEAGDSRWTHRPFRPAALYAARHDPATAAGRLFLALQRLIGLRKSIAGFSGGAVRGFWTGNRHVLGFLRPEAGGILVFANFGDEESLISTHRFDALPEDALDLVAGQMVSLREDLRLPPRGFVWLALGIA